MQPPGRPWSRSEAAAPLSEAVYFPEPPSLTRRSSLSSHGANINCVYSPVLPSEEKKKRKKKKKDQTHIRELADG